MQAYDLIMLIVLAMATIFGAIKGFAWQVASIASVIVSYIVAYRFRFEVAEMIQATPPWNQFLAMLLLYVGTSFVIWVAFRLLSGIIDRVRLKEFDRHLGAGFGFAKGLIYCLLITMFAMSLLGQNQQRAICQSKSGYYIAVALDKGVGILPKEIHDVVGPYLANLDDKLKNHQQGDSDVLDGNQEGVFDGTLPQLPEGLGGVIQDQLQNQVNQFGQDLSGQANQLFDRLQGQESQPGLGGNIEPSPRGLGANTGANIVPPTTTNGPTASFYSGSNPSNPSNANTVSVPTQNGLYPPTQAQPGVPPNYNSLRPMEQAQQPAYTVPR